VVLQHLSCLLDVSNVLLLTALSLLLSSPGHQNICDPVTLLFRLTGIYGVWCYSGTSED
jgi:hypothetical protein